MTNPPEVFVRIRAAAVALALAGMAGGCAGYRLGSMLPADVRTVFIPTFINQTDEPLLEAEATRATVAACQRDGSLRLASEQEADAVLEVVLNSYELEPIGYVSRRDSTVDEYRVVLHAAVVMRRRVGGDVLVEEPRLRGEASFPFAGDLASAKRQALPAVSEDLAQRIIETIVEAW